MDLREYLFRSGHTRKEFAKIIGISLSGLNQMLAGRLPRIDVGWRIEEASQGHVTTKQSDWVINKRVGRKKTKAKKT